MRQAAHKCNKSLHSQHSQSSFSCCLGQFYLSLFGPLNHRPDTFRAGQIPRHSVSHFLTTFNFQDLLLAANNHWQILCSRLDWEVKKKILQKSSDKAPGPLFTKPLLELGGDLPFLVAPPDEIPSIPRPFFGIHLFILALLWTALKITPDLQMDVFETTVSFFLPNLTKWQVLSLKEEAPIYPLPDPCKPVALCYTNTTLPPEPIQCDLIQKWTLVISALGKRKIFSWKPSGKKATWADQRSFEIASFFLPLTLLLRPARVTWQQRRCWWWGKSCGTFAEKYGFPACQAGTKGLDHSFK